MGATHSGDGGASRTTLGNSLARRSLGGNRRVSGVSSLWCPLPSRNQSRWGRTDASDHCLNPQTALEQIAVSLGEQRGDSRHSINTLSLGMHCAGHGGGAGPLAWQSDRHSRPWAWPCAPEGPGASWLQA